MCVVGVGGFEAAALVDRNIHHHGSALHAGQHLAAHQLRRRRAGNQNRADHQIRAVERFSRIVSVVGSQRDNLAVE